MLCFGGGVLLCTVFVHMIPEARENIEGAQQAWGKANEHEHKNHGHEHHDLEHQDHKHHGHEHHDHEHDHPYPWAVLVVCVGFLLIYLIEAVIHKVFGIGHDHTATCSSSDLQASQVEQGPEEHHEFLHDTKVTNGIPVEFKSSPSLLPPKPCTKRDLVRNILIVLALSVHSVFEGMAIGKSILTFFFIWHI